MNLHQMERNIECLFCHHILRLREKRVQYYQSNYTMHPLKTFQLMGISLSSIRFAPSENCSYGAPFRKKCCPNCTSEEHAPFQENVKTPPLMPRSNVGERKRVKPPIWKSVFKITKPSFCGLFEMILYLLITVWSNEMFE